MVIAVCVYLPKKAPLEYAPEKMYFMGTGRPILKVGGRNPQ
jgi:hypothetical protein